MPRASSTLLKLPPSDQMLVTRQFLAMPLSPAHQKAEVTCWTQTLFTSQFEPLKLMAPLLLLPALLTELVSRARFSMIEDWVVMILFTPWEFPLGVTR